MIQEEVGKSFIGMHTLFWWQNVFSHTRNKQLKSKVVNIITKDTTLWMNLNIDGTPISSHAHSQTSHLLSTSLSLGTPFPRFMKEQSEESQEQQTKHKIDDQYRHVPKSLWK